MNEDHVSDDQLRSQCELLLNNWNSLRPRLQVRYASGAGDIGGTCEVLARRMRPGFAFAGLFVVLAPLVIASAFVGTAMFILATCISLTLVVAIPWYLANQREEALLAKLSRQGKMELVWKPAELSGLTKNSFQVRAIRGFNADMTRLHVLAASSGGITHVIACSQLRPHVEKVCSALRDHLHT